MLAQVLMINGVFLRKEQILCIQNVSDANNYTFVRDFANTVA
jgi:hypothetical protein